MLVPIDRPILVPMDFPIASPMLVPAVVIDCSKTPPGAARAAAGLTGGAGLFAGAAGTAGDAGAAGDLLEAVRSTAPSVAEPALLVSNDGRDGNEPIKLEKEFDELPVPAPDPLVKLLNEGSDGNNGNDGKIPPEDLPFELELPPHGPAATPSTALTTYSVSVLALCKLQVCAYIDGNGRNGDRSQQDGIEKFSSHGGRFVRSSGNDNYCASMKSHSER